MDKMKEEKAGFLPRREQDSFRRSVRHTGRRAGHSPAAGILRGVALSSALTILSVAVFALLLNWWNASDRAVTAINQVVKFVSILAGTASAMRDREGRGAMTGAAVGLIYMALGIVCFCLLMGKSPQLTAYLADLGMGLAAGGLFGMILTAKKAG